MPITVSCPGCSARMKAPDATAGKKIKCPKCQGAISVPMPLDEPAFEVVEDEPVRAKKPPQPATKPKVKADVEVEDEDEIEDEKPKKKPVKAVVEQDEDEEDEKPRKKRKAASEDDDEDEDEKPRKKKKKQAAGGTGLARNIVGGAVLILLLGVVGFVYYDKFGKKEETTSSSSSSGDTPPTGSPGPGSGRPGPKREDGPLDGGNTPNTPSAQPKDKLGAARVGSPVLSADGTRVLARHIVGSGMGLSIWDASTGAPVVSIGTGTSPQPDAYGLSPDKKQVVIVSHQEKKLTLWSISGNLEKTINLPPWKDGTTIPTFATYTPDGKAVLTTYERQLLRVDTQTGTTEVLLKDVDTLSVRYVPEANAVVESGYNSKSFKPELRVSALNQLNAPKLMALQENESPQGCPDLTADGKTVAAFVMDRTNFEKPTQAIHLYDATTGQRKSKISSPVVDSFAQVGDLRISPDGRRVCFSGGIVKDGKRSDGCWVADVAGGNVQPLGTLGDSSIQFTRFAPDGKTIVVLAARIKVYDAEQAKDVTP